MRVRVAVDALGGDRGPDEVIAGAVEAAEAGVEPVLFGPGRPRDARARARRHDPGDLDGGEAGRGGSREAGQLARRRLPRRRRGARTGGRLRGKHGRDARRMPPGAAAPSGRDAARDRRPASRDARPLRPDRFRRERRCAARAPAPVRLHGLDLRRGDARYRAPVRPLALDRGGAREGESVDARSPRAAGRQRPAFRGKRGEPRPPRRARPTSSSATASPATSPSS